MIKALKLFTFTVILFSLLYSCSGTSGKNEEYKNIIKEDIVFFMEDLMSEGKWEGVIDMMYPKLFTISPKEQLITQMKQMEEMGIVIVADNTAVNNISDVMVYENEQFCEVAYTSDLTIQISGDALPMIKMLDAQFKQVYGAENVELNETENLFLVEANKSMIAVAPKNTNEWTYFEFNTSEPKILELLLPKEVRKKFL